MIDIHPNVQFLVETGYKFDDVMNCYYFIFLDGDYRAGNAVYCSVLFDIPLDYLEKWHERFLWLAKEHYDFSKGGLFND